MPEFATVRIHLYLAQEGGRKLPLYLGRLVYNLFFQAEGYSKVNTLEAIESPEIIQPGEIFDAKVVFITQVAISDFPVGSIFFMREGLQPGANAIGKGEVLERWRGSFKDLKIAKDYSNPTVDDVRVWGYDDDAWLRDQDEDLVLHSPQYIPVLIELASDSACPKKDLVLRYLEIYAKSAFDRRKDRLTDSEKEAFKEGALLARASSIIGLREWAKWVLQQVA